MLLYGYLNTNLGWDTCMLLLNVVILKYEANGKIRLIELIPFRHCTKCLGCQNLSHPLVSLVRNCDVKMVRDEFPSSLVLNFYKISYMENFHGRVKYGQNYYDFDEGGMVFVAPEQLLTAPDEADEYEGFNLFVHPDFLQTYPLATTIKKYNFFSYATNEALHLSEKENNH